MRTALPSNALAVDMRERIVLIGRGDPIEAGLGGSSEHMAAVFALAKELNGLTRTEDILDRVAATAMSTFVHGTCFTLARFESLDDIPSVVPAFVHYRPGLTADRTQALLSRTVLTKVARSGMSLLFVKDEEAQSEHTFMQTDVSAALCAPLVGQHGLLGVIQLDSRGRSSSVFVQEDLDLFTLLASSAAFALERVAMTQSIEHMFEGFVRASVSAIEARDPTTAGHSQRVADYALELAQAVNYSGAGAYSRVAFSDLELRELRYAALLHDFGKIGVRETVLGKATRLPVGRFELIAQRFETIKAIARLSAPPEAWADLEGRVARALAQVERIARGGPLDDRDLSIVERLGSLHYVGLDGGEHPWLTPDEVEHLRVRRGTLHASEWDEMRSHASQTADFLNKIPWSRDLDQVPCIAGQHHEKLDGTGYPLGLTAERLGPQVRILSIADIFDAITAADRPYRKAGTVNQALVVLQQETALGKLDGDLVELFASRVVPRILHMMPRHGS